MANKSEDGFHEAMIGIYHAAAALGYRAPYFLRMVQERGGLGAAKHLLSGLTRSRGSLSSGSSDVLTSLWRHSYLKNDGQDFSPRTSAGLQERA